MYIIIAYVGITTVDKGKPLKAERPMVKTDLEKNTKNKLVSGI